MSFTVLPEKNNVTNHGKRKRAKEAREKARQKAIEDCKKLKERIISGHVTTR